MAATQLSRLTLNNLFSDGERPTGENFASAWLSFLHLSEDGLSYDGTNLVIGSNTGITLGNPPGGPGGTAGTLRFNGTSVQVYDPAINDFKDIAGGAGAFVPVGAGPAVAYAGGNVGIGTFVAPGPTRRLEVPLNDHVAADPGTEVLLGKLLVHNGPAAKTGTYISNSALANNAVGYALFQDGIGKTRINAPGVNNSQLSLAINESDKLVITKDGDISLSPTNSIGMSGVVAIGSFIKGSVLSITNRTDLPTGVAGIAALTLTGDSSGPGVTPTLIVNGLAQKTNGGVWGATSDKRVKKEIRPFNEGLKKLLLFDPVVYKFNGKGGTIDNGRDYIGLIAQDVEKVMPDLIISQRIKLDAEDNEESEVLGHDLSPLTFMFINAMKELNDRVEKLEKLKKNAKRTTGSSSGTDNR